MSLSSPRSLTVALTSAALMGLSTLAVPGVAGAQPAQCSDADATYEVSGGSIEWGVKQSFRSYLNSPIAHGGWELDGTTFEGQPTGADGRFVWPIDSGTTTDATSATASGTGSVRLTGHDEILDTTITNPTVEIDGSQGTLKADYRAKKVESFTPDAPFVWVDGTQAIATTFTLPTAPNFHTDGTVTVTSPATQMNAEFVEAFAGMYKVGDGMDAITLSLDVTRTCTDGGDNGDDDEGTVPSGVLGSLSSIVGSLGS